jgi:predicted dehydrogenase
VNNKLKIGLLGGSINSAVGRAHVAALRLNGRYDLVAGFMSRDENLNNKSADEYGLSQENRFQSFEKLIKRAKDEDLTVLVCTPTDQHSNQVSRCLEEGINVICEKALSDSVASLYEMQKIQESSNASLSVIYNYTSFPAIRLLRTFIEDKKFGKILKINAYMPQEGFIKRGANNNPIIPQPWRLKDGEIPTISLDLGVHLHSLVKFLTAESAKSLVGIESSNGNFHGVIDDVRCTAIYTNDLEANFWFSKIALGHRNGLRIEIYGSEASAVWEQINPEQIIFTNSVGEKTIIDRGSPNNLIGNDTKYNYFKAGHPTGFIEALSNYYVDIHELRSGNTNEELGRNIYGLPEALEGLKFLSQIHESSINRSWVDL